MSNNKVLFQVELLPPNQGELQRVKDVINQVTQAERKAQQAAQQNTRRQQTDATRQYKNELLALRNEIEENEQATRFNNKAKDETLQKLQSNIGSADQLRDKIETLNVSTTEELKLRQKANAVYKRANLAHGRIQADFKQMARVGGAANQTLLETGRIVSDLPFGFLGISNNVEASTASFANLMRTSGGVTGALKQMKTALLGPSGLVVLFSSVVPAAVTFATIGLRNWGISAAKTTKEQERLEESTRELIKGYNDLFEVAGPDPTGLQAAQSQVRELKALENALEDILGLMDEIERAESFATAMGPRAPRQFAQRVTNLEDTLNSLKEEFSLTTEEINDFEKSLDKAEKTQEKLIDRLDLAPLQEFRVRGIMPINDAMSRFEMGLRRTADGTEPLRFRLIDLREDARRLETSFQALADQGNEDVLPYLKAVQERLEELDDAFPDAPDKPIIDVVPPDDEIQEGIKRLDKQLSDFENEYMGDDPFGDHIFLPDPDQVQKFNDKAFKIRTEMLDDSVAIHAQKFHLINQVEREAAEHELENHESVERLKAAITERFVHQRHQIELERERNLMEAKMGIWSEFSNFVSATNKALFDDSLALSLFSLALEKGLAIADVITEANARVFELNAAASAARAQASIAAASGNFPQALALNTAALKTAGHAAKIKANAMKTAGIIAATGLMEGIGQVTSAGGSGGGAGTTSGSGRGGQYGFVTDDVEGREDDRRRNRIPQRIGQRQDRNDVYVFVDNKVDEKGIASLVQKGNRQRDKTLQGIKSIQK